MPKDGFNIKKADGNLFYLTPLTATPDILVNYELIERSDGKVISIDRGYLTDRYASKMVFRGAEGDIDELYVVLQDLRDANTEALLSGFDDNYFGDHVDHSSHIHTVVSSIKELQSPNFGVKQVEVTFLASGVSLIGSTTLPTMLCLGSEWSGYNSWNFNVNETYTRNNFFVNSEADKFVFEGKFTLTKEVNRDLYRFWTYKRGASFTINESSIGVSGMFGPNVSGTSHTVVIESIDYKEISPSLRETVITLIRN